MNSLFCLFLSSFAQEKEPERIGRIDAFVDHLLVAFFKNVQGKNDVGEEDEVR
jgi:hypothetical protein